MLLREYYSVSAPEAHSSHLNHTMHCRSPAIRIFGRVIDLGLGLSGVYNC